jgi:nitrogenase-associated protein
MPDLIFYEKPGCIGNRRQQSLLREQGCLPVVRNLLSEPWTAERLRAFFAGKPVSEWFNSSAPSVKSGDIEIHRLDEPTALALMSTDPLLICRPLLEFGEIRQSGFEPGPVLTALGINLPVEQDLQSCPVTASERACAESA